MQLFCIPLRLVFAYQERYIVKKGLQIRSSWMCDVHSKWVSSETDLPSKFMENCFASKTINLAWSLILVYICRICFLVDVYICRIESTSDEVVIPDSAEATDESQEYIEAHSEVGSVI